MIKIVCFVLFFTSFNVFSQVNLNLCEKIYGEWEIYYSQLPFRMNSKDQHEIWKFDKNGTITINNKTTPYKLEKDCSKLIILDDSDNFFSIEILNDSLNLNKIILTHESYNIRLKRLIK